MKARTIRFQGVAVTPFFGGMKLGLTTATYLPPEHTCDLTACRFAGSGCFAEYYMVAKNVRDAQETATLDPSNHLAYAYAEKHVLDRLTTGLPLRGRVSGDSKDEHAASVWGAAAEAWVTRNLAPSWTYTHAWRTIDRAAWGRTAVHASCETPEDIAHATEIGYSVALVSADFPSRTWKIGNTTVVACRAQIEEDTTCRECRLCFRTDLRAKHIAVGFRPHGSGASAVQRALLDAAAGKRRLAVAS